MIGERIRMDSIVKFLIDRSDLTRAQLDTYSIERLGRREGLGLKEMVKLRDGGPVKKGAFLRTLKQARRNLEESICTIILAEYLGFFDRQTITALAEVGGLISSLDKQELSDGQTESMIQVLIRIIKSLE